MVEDQLQEEVKEAMKDAEANKMDELEYRETLAYEEQLQEEAEAEGPQFAPDYEWEESWADTMSS